MSDGTIRVLLVDDHAVVREGFRRLMEQDPGIEVVAEADSGETACQAFAADHPDVVVMDLNMPGIGGIAAIQRIVARSATARILVFSMHEGSAFAIQAMKAGARGYLTKASAPDEIVAAVRGVAGGQTYLSADVAQKIALHHVDGGDNPAAMLSAREFEIFRLLAEGRSIEDIAETSRLSTKTVANYQTQVKQKLNVSSSAELVRLAIRYRVIDGAG